jgi:hypothetical protein
MDPEECAEMHVDKHVVKMILETTQLLCSAHHVSGNKTNFVPMYKLTHKNHPCSIWVRKSTHNYIWLVRLGKALCKEYTRRYNRIHKCESYIEELFMNLPDVPCDDGFTTPPQAMPDKYKNTNYIIAYRKYYMFDKSHIHSWKTREPPMFIVRKKLIS